MSKSKPKSYIRPDDGATMIEVEPHQYVNAKILRLQNRLPDGHQHDDTAASSGTAIAAGPGSSQAASSGTEDLVSSACYPGKCRRPQASRVALAKSCCSNNSSGDDLAHHVGLHVSGV